MPCLRTCRHQLARLVLVALATPVPLSAHDFWIEPSSYRVTAEQDVDLELREGERFKGNTIPYITDWFTDFSLTTDQGEEPVFSWIGNDPAAVIEAADGQTLIGYQSVRNFVELEAEKFNSYLENEGIEFLREERRKRGEDDAPAPEYFIRCAKALIDSGTTSSAIYARQLGYRLELVPRTNPYNLRDDGRLEFDLLYNQKPIEGLLVQAFNKATPDDIQKVRTDANGRATVVIDKPGAWMVKAVQIQPIIGDPKAKWQSYWATFVFAGPD